MTYKDLKDAITTVIRPNYNQDITAIVLHDLLEEIVNMSEENDNRVLNEANKYTSQREESIRTDFATADQYVLSQAKEYADTVKDWNNEDNRKKIWTGSQDEYDALPTKDPNTIYLTDDHAVTVTPTSLSFYVDQNSRTLTINCEANDQWVVTPDLPDDWQVSPLSGTGPGTITVTATANSTSTPRNGSLAISSGGLSIHVPCDQDGIPERDELKLVLYGSNYEQGIIEVCTDTRMPVQDDLTIEVETGGGDFQETNLVIHIYTGHYFSQYFMDGAVDSARISLVNGNDTGKYAGMNADYTWDKF